jgi:hypothetical protein
MTTIFFAFNFSNMLLIREEAQSSNEDDTDDILFLLLTLQSLRIQAQDVESRMDGLLAEHIRQQRILNWSLPEEKNQITWIEFIGKLTTQHFRRMFRTTLESFDLLCSEIMKAIGEDSFVPERNLDPVQQARHKVPLIAGEVKVAVGL